MMPDCPRTDPKAGTEWFLYRVHAENRFLHDRHSGFFHEGAFNLENAEFVACFVRVSA
jgi:hypothetical protein